MTSISAPDDSAPRSWTMTAGLVVGFAFTHWVTIVKQDASRLWLVPLILSLFAAIVWWRSPRTSNAPRLIAGAVMGGWLAASAFGATFTFHKTRLANSAWMPDAAIAPVTLAAILLAIVLLATNLTRVCAQLSEGWSSLARPRPLLLAVLWGALVGVMLTATSWASIITGFLPLASPAMDGQMLTAGSYVILIGTLAVLCAGCYLLRRPHLGPQILSGYLGLEVGTLLGIALSFPSVIPGAG